MSPSWFAQHFSCYSVPRQGNADPADHFYDRSSPVQCRYP